MARAAVQVKNREVVGNDVRLQLYVIFFGTDMAAPDSTIIEVLATGTDTFATWKARRNAAISAEAQRLGITWNGKIVSDSDLLRDA